MRTLLLLTLAVSLQAQPFIQQRDKQLHAAVGFSIAFTGSGFKHPKAGLALAIGVGVGKELYDRRHAGHTADAKDALATAGGALIGYGLGRLVFGPPRSTDPHETIRLEREAAKRGN